MSLSYIEVAKAAKGRWMTTILPKFQIVVPPKPMMHGPCPTCGGDDRFRFDDKDGKGTWFCSGKCDGAGDGFALVANKCGFDKSEVLHEVAAVLGITQSNITDAQRKQWEKEAKDRRIAEEKETLRIHNLRAREAKTQWSKLDAVHPSPYAIRKQIEIFTCRTDAGGLLYVPLYDVAGKLWNIQTIHPDGTKRPNTGARVTGNFHLIGEIDPNGYVYICEGFATGASVCMASRIPTVVALTTVNLKPVALALRAAYPKLRMLFCADNDIITDGNPGITYANAAAALVGGHVVYPNFGYTAEEIEVAKAAKLAEKNALIDAVDEEDAA